MSPLAEMTPSTPEVSVVVATRNRAARLAALFGSLQAQTLGIERFEVVVVDDASTDETHAVIAAARERRALHLRVIRREASGGPATARNAGWRSAGAPLVAFTDDDCVAAPRWLEKALAAAREHEGAVVQGRTDPIPEEHHLLGPFTRTMRVNRLGPYYQTCNIFYPRELLERLGGFDESYRLPSGEDTDLAWRAIESGRETVFAADARVFHAVNELGPIGRLRVALKWGGSVALFRRHPELRAVHLYRGVFWTGYHYLLLRAMLALLLRRRLPRVVLNWLGAPYLVSLLDRAEARGGRRLLAPYWLLVDLMEMYAMLRASIRHRTLVI